jgi:hypothetical protein
MGNQSIGEPTLLPEDDEVLGEPSFEILVRDGEPIISGSYFIHPPLRAVDAEWDQQQPGRLLVRADDGSVWCAEDVPRAGAVSVQLRPVAGAHRAYRQPD